MMSCNSHSSLQVSIIVNAILSKRKLRFRKTKEPSQGHKSREPKGQESTLCWFPESSSPLVWGQGSLEAEAVAFPSFPLDGVLFPTWLLPGTGAQQRLLGRGLLTHSTRSSASWGVEATEAAGQA